MMENIISNPIVIENVIMLVSVLLCFLMAVIFGNKYNHGASKAFLIMSRLFIIVAAALTLIWIF